MEAAAATSPPRATLVGPRASQSSIDLNRDMVAQDILLNKLVVRTLFFVYSMFVFDEDVICNND